MQSSLALIPVWIFPIFLFLLFWAFRLCEACTVKTNRLLVLPILFTLITFHHFLKPQNITVYNFGGTLIGLALGIYWGYLYKRDAGIKIDRARDLIYLPADNKLILFILSSFALEFSMVALEGDPIWWFHPVCMLLSAIITGMIIGRNGTYYYRFLHNQAESL